MVQSGTMGADLSYLLAVVFTVLFLVSWWMAKKGQGTRHHKLILISMVSMVVYFVAYYYAKNLGVLSAEGKEGFGGPLEVYNSIFLPVLYTHLTLVTLGLILTPYMIVEGFRASQKINGQYSLISKDLKSQKKDIMWFILITGVIWLVFEGILILMGKSKGAQIAYFIIFISVSLVEIGLDKLFEKWLPDGARRHRVLGRVTMIMFALILVTSTSTYLMLYVIYPLKAAVG